jgi:hypothetical protein
MKQQGKIQNLSFNSLLLHSFFHFSPADDGMNVQENLFQPTAENKQLLDSELNTPANGDYQSSVEQRYIFYDFLLLSNLNVFDFSHFWLFK